MNTAWEHVKDNIKISAKERLGLERVCSQTQLCQFRCFNDYN